MRPDSDPSLSEPGIGSFRWSPIPNGVFQRRRVCGSSDCRITFYPGDFKRSERERCACPGIDLACRGRYFPAGKSRDDRRSRYAYGTFGHFPRIGRTIEGEDRWYRCSGNNLGTYVGKFILDGGETPGRTGGFFYARTMGSVYFTSGLFFEGSHGSLVRLVRHSLSGVAESPYDDYYCSRVPLSGDRCHVH